MNAFLLFFSAYSWIIIQTTPLQPVFDAYFNLKDALVKTDGNDAAAKGTVLLTALNAVDMNALSKEEHAQWMKSKDTLIADATQISKTKNVEKQRTAFTTLSSNMYLLVKSADLASPVYWQHCPMANDGKGGDWLSKESSVVNPYYGSMMLHCGKMVEKIE